MQLYFHSSQDVMERAVRHGFVGNMGSGGGIRLTTESPVVAGEPVLVIDVPDYVAKLHQRAFRPGEFILSPDVLNWFPVRKKADSIPTTPSSSATFTR